MQDGVNANRDGMLTLDSAYNFARFLSCDAEAAEHIVQAAFLRSDGETGPRHRTALLKGVRNCYRTWLTTRGRRDRQSDVFAHKRVPDTIAGSVLRTDDRTDKITVGADVDASAVRCAIETLPRRLREILVLRELGELSYREISEVTSLNMSEVISRLACARRRVARSIAQGQ
ncbi:RNA polymerase subunit sigma [Bradyrhizobium sp. INPA01-394B]|uniref:RNA polymerase subunit sigma n=1 Tax=Bradyrhizobium campsiandrae TaxID=1729892 RepID=A0ABR7UB46_9BRAD|nr:sigma factor-like helix-turn-helix DNA-binding protein [Bradyrhizobium campsiandrae]MBC9883349.1 RNA polymerase subunit sigma [Bradyrhizobium campsiandrae]MBC9981311.1 RNA polymerase subunit sigma [Bradyrhizobium campsiandrae]